MTDECFEKFKDWVAGTKYTGPIRPALMTQSFNGMELDNLESNSLWKGWKAAWKYKENQTNKSDAEK